IGPALSRILTIRFNGHANRGRGSRCHRLLAHGAYNDSYRSVKTADGRRRTPDYWPCSGAAAILLRIRGVLRSRASQLALVLAAALFPAVLHADVIYSNFGEGDSFLAGSGLIVTRDGAAWSSVAIAFVPAFSYSLSSIEFAGSNLVPGSTGASLAVFADDDGHPDGTPLETIALDGLMASFGDPAALLKVKSAAHPVLEEGQTYWIGMNAAAGGLAVWNQTTALTAGFSTTDGAGNWSARDEVQGAVELKGKL